ncbi:DsrE family protein [Sphingomonas sp. 1P06PA]|uniref:DsrE family protein n=1 Tax=Sphingomonas sp. 1P06PA TaxID=554121 RepID=UPI0039A4E66F
MTIIIARPDPVALRTALGIALSAAALGGRARLFVDTAAVPLLRVPVIDPADDAQVDAGLPTLAGLLDEADQAGVAILACQAGLALAGLALPDLVTGTEAAGMVSLLQTLADDRLLTL